MAHNVKREFQCLGRSGRSLNENRGLCVRDHQLSRSADVHDLRTLGSKRSHFLLTQLAPSIGTPWFRKRAAPKDVPVRPHDGRRATSVGNGAYGCRCRTGPHPHHQHAVIEFAPLCVRLIGASRRSVRAHWTRPSGRAVWGRRVARLIAASNERRRHARENQHPSSRTRAPRSSTKCYPEQLGPATVCHWVHHLSPNRVLSTLQTIHVGHQLSLHRCRASAASHI